MNNNKNNNALVDSLYSQNKDNEESRQKLIESSEKLRIAREKARRQNATSSSSNQEEEEEEEEEEDEEDDDSGLLEEVENLDEEDKKGLLNGLKNLLSKVGMKTLIAGGATIGTTGVLGLAMVSIYRVHFNGEFEFKGIGSEYQSSSYKNMNYTSFDETGNVQLGGLTKENKLTKTYYTLYSDNSYYAVVEDSKKYKNIDDAYKRENLLTPEELREQYPDIQDTEGREKMFQLNPDVLYSLDRYLHKNQFLYPQQFTKPVFYEESKDKFALKMLTDKNGRVVAKSQSYNSDGTPKKENGSLKKERGIWDYGLASILHYKEYEVKERTVTSLSGAVMTYKGSSDSTSRSTDNSNVRWSTAPSVGSEITNTIIGGNNPPDEHPGLSTGISKETVRDTPAYAIDKAVTAGGTINSTVAQRWQEKSGTRKTVKKTYIITETESKTVSTGKDEDEDGVIDTTTITRTHTYEVVYTYEIYTEEYVPYYEGDLDTSDIVGSQYYRQYISNYTNYIPNIVPKELDFSVLDNEEISELFVNDEPNAYGYGSGATNSTSSAVATEAEFKNAVFMGDSLTVGLGGNVDSITTFAKSGNTVSKGISQHLQGVIDKKPPVVVISYGTNDAGYENTESFVKDYKDLISKLKAGIPNVKIYLNKIFPGDVTKPSVNSDGKKIIANIPSYNNALNQIASESGVTLIDCTGIPNLKSYYEPDGIHFKSSFYKLWYDEMKKKIVSGTGTINNGASTPKTYFVSNNSNSRTDTTTGSLTLPAPREGEDRSVFDVLSIGSKKDGQNVLKSLKYLPIFEKYGNMYGVDPYLLVALCATESGGNPNSYNGSARGLMQIEYNTSKVIAYNHTTKQTDTITVNHGRLFEPDYNVQIGTMQLAQKLKDKQYNILVGIQGYNFGEAGIDSAIQYYLSGGNLTAQHTVNSSQVDAYIGSNHVGWITALFPGDMPNESKYSELNSSDGKHSARTWYSAIGYKKYSSDGHGTPVHLDRVLAHYAGSGSPWVMDESGNIYSIDGSATGYVGGNSSAITAFNSFLASNWATILEKKDILFPWANKLDTYLVKVKRDKYDELKTSELIGIKNNSLFVSNMTPTDETIILSMMFALNQGNYLSKYDFMGEAEWKAMYNQLLSSPTGKTWDDKWIGFTSEDVFNKDLESLGTLFKDNAGINPVISRKFGLLKNIYTDDDTTKLVQYNETNFGIDISVPEDSEVLAIDNGTIIGLEKDRSILGRYGNYVKIKYNDKTTMIVANLNSITKGLKIGSKVTKGDVLGTSGGKCKSYKEGDIHIELLFNGEFINPEWIITRDMKGFEDPIQGNTGATCGSGAGTNVSNNPIVNKAIEVAKQQIGKPYVWGATGPNSFDCSGFMFYIMKVAGVEGGRLVAKGYYDSSTEVPRDQAQPGDFVFWHDLTGSKHSPVYHIGLYMGNDEVIDCSTDHKGVGTRKLSDLKDSSKRRFTIGRYSPFVGSTGGGGVSSSVGCQTSNSITNNGNYLWPVPDSPNISSYFGEWRDNNTRQHKGIDISGKYGGGDSRDYKLPIVSTTAGEVVEVTTTCPTDGSYGSNCGGGWGNYVKVKDAEGKIWIYAHMTQGSVSVSKGQTVTQGQQLGTMGNSGSSKGVHLHYEVRVGGDAKENAVDPLEFVKPPS